MINSPVRFSWPRNGREHVSGRGIRQLLLMVLCLPGDLLPEGLAPVAAASASQESVQRTEYQGEFTQGKNDDNAILRRVDVLLLSSGGSHFFNVLDDASSGCPWPDSYGRLAPGGEATGVQPHLLYEWQNTVYSVGLPPLVVTIPEQAEVDTTWEYSGWTMRLLERRVLDGVDCWMLEARERRGRRQVLFVESATGILVKSRTDVFLGQGDQFELTLNRTSTDQLAPETATRVMDLQARLLTLQKDLNRRTDAQHRELSARQVETAAQRRQPLHELADGTPLQELLMRLSTDVTRQQERLAASSARAGELLNSSAPRFSLNLIQGGSLDSDSLKGQVVVLHFWDYRDQPLMEPYGQTGYLDFIFNQRKKLNVQVVGVSTSQDFLTADNLARGKRSVRKLAEFMNLTYPIAWDDGSLLKSLGDPRESNGQLPLWVVLTPEGKVVHYHAGYYEIDPAKGLQQLDEILIEQIRRSQAEGQPQK